MSHFIEVHEITKPGRTLLLNVNEIQKVYSNSSHTELIVRGFKYPILIEEKYEEIKEMLNSGKEI